MRTTHAVLAALMPAIVVAAPASKSPSEAAGFTRNATLPKWAVALADIPRTERSDPLVLRLNETQALVGPTSSTLYNRAIQVNDSSELGAIGQYALSYFAQYQKLTLHRVVILRGEQRIDRTASVSIRPLQRETNIESGMMGGATSLQLLLDDVRIGDTLWITYTIDGENPVFGKHWSADFNWDAGAPIELRRVTITHPNNRPLQWRQLGDFQTAQVTPQVEALGEMTRLRFEGRALESVEGEPSVPSDYLPVRLLQVTEYQDWHSVANWADGLFPKNEASPALKALARQFAAEPDAQARASAALHWVQNEIRYFSVSIGENSHRPQLPDVVLKRRYGDCKDKSYLLVSLLRELGIPAQPVLLSADAPKLARKLLPTPGWFNHVIVQISLDGHEYYVDPTRINQPEPLASLPIAFPGAQVLRVNAATQGLSEIPERSDTLPTFEHNEDIVIADFSGAATLVTRDVYRSTYADGIRAYYPRMSLNEQKKSVLSKYEKLYPGIVLEGAPEYRDIVAENRVEVTSRYKLPKAVTLKDKRYQIDFSSQVIEGTLGIPAKLVRNFPFELAGGRFNGRYRLRIQWPEQVRRNDPPHVKMLDNPYFQVREEYALRGSDMDYLMDYRLKQRSIPAAELPVLGEQSKRLNEMVEGSMRIEESAVTAKDLQTYSLRDLESLRDSGDVLARMAQLKNRKEADISVTEACDYVNAQHELGEFIGYDAIKFGQQLEKRVGSAKPQPGMGACLASLALARGESQTAAAALAADPLPNDTSPLLREVAWAQFYSGDAAAALATMARYSAAREQAAGGASDAADAASRIALLQRAKQPLPAALERFARELPEGPWPHPVLAMQLGLLSEAQLLKQAESMRRDSRALALNDAWLYIGQARLVAGDHEGAVDAFRWLSGNGLRNHWQQRQARREIRAEFERDRDGAAGMQAMLNRDYAGAVAAWQVGAASGSAASRHGLGLAAYYGQGLPKSLEQARSWFQLAAAQGYVEAQGMLGTMYLYGEGGARDVPQGLELLRQAAARGDAASQAELGRRYRWGYGVKQDYAQALQFLLRAADQGQAAAMAQLGAMYRHAEGVAQDYGMADFWNRRALMYGNALATYNLGLAAEAGEATEPDMDKAVLLFRAAAERGHGDAANKLGTLYEKGLGVPQNYAEALAWYRKGVELDNTYAMRNLSEMYGSGRGVARDLDVAERYLRQAVEHGDGLAMNSLGYLLDRKRQTPEAAIPWYEKAAALHISDAEFNLALAYETGSGVKADPAKAYEWYRRAAEDGDLDAQYSVAQSLFYGDVVKQNRAEAVQWYTKSATQGKAAAQGKLGEIYLSGWGVPVDAVKAVEWLRMAAAQNWKEAYINLGKAHERGLGVEQDVAQAIAWYDKAGDDLRAQVRLGTLLLRTGQQQERGRRLLEQADAQTTAADFATLARAYRAVDNKDKTEWAYARGLDLEEHGPGGSDNYLHDYLDAVASYYRDKFDFEKAAPLMLRQLRLAEQLFDANSAELMAELEAIGDLYQNLGRYAEAEAQYQRVLDNKQQVHGAQSVEVAEMLDSMAGLFLAAEQYDQALAYQRRSLSLFETLDENKIASQRRHLGVLLLARGEYAEAQKMLLRSLALDQARLGTEHLTIIGTLNTLAMVYERQQAYDQASTTMEHALRLQQKLDANDAFQRAIFQTNLALIRIGQKRYAEAEELLAQAQAAKALKLGDNHPEMSYGLYAQGLLYQRQRQYDKALPPLQRALQLRESSSRYNGNMAAEILQELGETYRLQGMDAQAEPLLMRALSIRSRTMPEQHPELKATRRSLAELQRKSGRT